MPDYFIIPSLMFERKHGILLADLENPIIHKITKENSKEKKTNLICSKSDVDNIRQYLQECILGPILINEKRYVNKIGEKDDEIK